MAAPCLIRGICPQPPRRSARPIPKEIPPDVSHAHRRPTAAGAQYRGRRGRRRGDHELGQPGGGVLDGADPGPEGHPRVGARLRRRRHAPRGARVGREGADAVADHRGGRQDRAVRLRRARAVLRRPDRPDAADRQRGALLGRRRHRHVDHGHRARRRRDLRPGHRRADRRMDPALLRHPRGPEGRRVLRLGAQRRLGRLARPHDAPSSTRRPASGSSTARRRGRPTAASPTCTSSSPPSTASSAPKATPRSSCR